ncbi:hypothetical protein BC826DRAFT_994774 [Russula brevipes]|nr:hypothetical protein BC826DRAFT_994774 [Russula brevipes]
MGARRSTGTRGPSCLPAHVHAYPQQAAPPMVTLPAPASYSAFASTATTTTGTTTLRQAHPAPLGCSHLVPPNVSSFSWPLRLKSCTGTFHSQFLTTHLTQVFRLRACKLRAFSLRLVRVIWFNWLTHQRIWLRADRLHVNAHNLGMNIRVWGLRVAPMQARLRADRLCVSSLFDGHSEIPRGCYSWVRVCTR